MKKLGFSLKLKLIIVTSMWFSQTHHMSLSGYHQLVRYISLPKVIIFPRQDKVSIWLTAIMNKYLYKLSYIIKGEFYSIGYVGLELKSLLSKAPIVHHLYGEDTYRISAFLKPTGKKFVVTLHQPPSYFMKVMPLYWMKALNNADQIIVLSTTQAEFLSKFLSRPIDVIPHGVDVQRFPQSSYKRPNCLIVGQWLRDFHTIIRVLRKLRERDDIIFDVVLPKATPRSIVEKFRALALKQRNLNVHFNISDSSLMKLYAESSMFLLCLEDFTASNALLEAMASALPIIVTDVGGVRDYIDEKCAILVKRRDVNGIINSILYLLEDENAKRSLGRRAREKAYNFDWRRIAPRYEKIYEALEPS